MKKEQIIMPDGRRYLIFYTFDDVDETLKTDNEVNGEEETATGENQAPGSAV
ncbi:MAG: hypothetical protein H7Z37_17775 [Pyrinomonadaceae bacterium]|nr:hypothetical protein [Pyrinomonadaceae bacterium]